MLVTMMRRCWMTPLIIYLGWAVGGSQAFSLHAKQASFAPTAAFSSPLFRSKESLRLIRTRDATTKTQTQLGASVSSPSSSSSSSSTSSSITGEDLASAFSTSSPLGRFAVQERKPSISAWKATLTKFAMMSYIVGMCIALPVTLIPQRWLYQLRLIDRRTKEAWAVRSTGFVARWMLRLIPFCQLNVIPAEDRGTIIKKLPQPSIWVCNHTSLLDVFLLLAADYRLRGSKMRPIKIVYWKGLESNFVTKLMFTQAGFISVDMEANGNGSENNYDRKTFKKLLKDCKQAFEEGYDVGLMPEGQPNPHPEQGMLPVFTGAYTLAKMSRRPIQLMALHGAHHLWPATGGEDDDSGSPTMKVTGRTVTVRCYPDGRVYSSPEEFKVTVETVVGHFGATGRDLGPPAELKGWLTGATWKKQQDEKAAAELLKKQQERVAEQLRKHREEEEERQREAAAEQQKQAKQ